MDSIHRDLPRPVTPKKAFEDISKQIKKRIYSETLKETRFFSRKEVKPGLARNEN
jgi:hypothetical protein